MGRWRSRRPGQRAIAVGNKSDNDSEEQVWYTQTSFLIAVAFLVLVLVVGVVLVATGPGHGSATAAPRAGGSALTVTVPAPLTAEATSPVPTMPSPATAASPGTSFPSAGASSSSSTSASACGLPAGGQAVPSTPPSATSWQFIGSIAVPTSKVYGPAKVIGGIGSCFAHSPTGALFAMENAVALTEVPSDQISAVAVVERRGSRSAAYAQALQEAEQEDSATSLPSDPSTTPKVTLIGFRYVDYTPDRATISLAIGLGDPSMPSTYQPSLLTAVVAWEGGDWRFVYSGDSTVPMSPIVSTEQYTPWAA